MTAAVPSDPLTTAARVAARHPGLTLLLLHGSRARGDAHSHSDWDFAYLADGRLDPDALLADLVLAMGSDRVDLADLSRAGGLLRYRAARDGRPVFEGEEGAFERFWLQAVTFWCDAEPVLRRGYEAILAELRR